MELHSLYKELNIVIFSLLLSHGGGRETWLNTFLPNLLSKDPQLKVNVFYIVDETAIGQRLIELINDPNINFIGITLPSLKNKITSIFRIAIFSTLATWKIYKNGKDGSVVLAVGTFHESFVLFLLNMVCFRKFTLVIWIRCVFSKITHSRHDRLTRAVITFIEKKLMFVANKIISNGHDTKIFYEQLLERHVEAIPNAIEVKKYSLISRKAFSNQQITIAYIGRLSDEKGIRAFMQSIVLYNATINIGNLNFEIVGDGPLSYLVEKFQVDTPNVTYLGPIANSDMLSYLSRIDVGVCLTFSGEIGGGGVSNGLLELLASKRLAITWDSDIFRQVVSDDSSYLVKENDVKCLAECYLMLSKDSAQFNRRIEHGFQVVQLYSFDSHIEKYLNYVYT